jgi:hypothetical protein
VNRPSRENAPGRKKDVEEPITKESIISGALELDSPLAREQALAEIVRSELESNPEIATEALMHLPAGSEERAKTLRFIASYLVQKNKDEALAWVETLTEQEDIAIAKGEVIEVLGMVDPAAAAKIVLEPRVGNHPLSESDVAVLQNWVASSPAQAAAWVQNLQQGEARQVGVNTLASQWIQVDPNAAFSWTAAIQNPVARKEAIVAMAEALVAIPEPIRNSLLEGADSTVRAELEPLVNQATQETVDPAPEEPE